MNARKRKLYLMAPLFLGLFFGLWAATQYLAYRTGWHTSLGEPLLRGEGFALYAPWDAVRWWVRWHQDNPKLFRVAEDAPIIGMGLGIFVSMLLHKLLPPPPQESDVHGSARWASEADDQNNDLVCKPPLSLNSSEKDGVIIGQTDEGDFLIDNDPTHILAFAPTRSGKGVGIVVPTLLNWQGSVVVLDIKGENWELTAGWRDQFSHTLRFNPRDPESARYNPLLEIRPEADVADAQALAGTLCDPDGKGELDHWKLSAKDLLVGVILHILYAEEDKSLAGVAAFLSDPDWETPTQMYERMLDAQHTANGTHPQVAAIAKSLINKNAKERSSIESTALSVLQLWRDPVVAANTRTSDFRVHDLMNAAVPVSLYLDVPPADLERVKPLLRLMVIQFCQVLSEDFGNAVHRLLWMLDEFPVLGKMNFWESALAYIAGAKMKACMICQDLKQLDKSYGDKNAIMANAHTKVTFAANDEMTAKRVSDLLGKTTVDEKRISYSGSYQALLKTGQNESYSHVGRPLLTPGEVLQLPYEDELILRAGKRPQRARKVMYYKDSHFVQRTEHDVPASRVPAGTFSASRPDPWTCVAPGADDFDFFKDFTADVIRFSPNPHNYRDN